VKIFCFKGRASVREFRLWTLCFVVLTILTVYLCSLLGIIGSRLEIVMVVIIGMLLLQLFSVYARRLHDLDKEMFSDIWFSTYFALYFTDGGVSDNRFGSSPVTKSKQYF